MEKELEDIVTSKMTDSQRINIEIIKNIVSINTALNDLQHTVEEDHEILVTGNGEISLRETVRAHDAFIKEIRYWIKFIFGVVITQSIGLALAGIFLVFRLIPLLEKLP